MRPFNEKRFKYNWHWFWDTGNGDIGNQGVHEIGVCRWGLGDPEWPKSRVRHGRQVRLHRRPGDAQHAARQLRLRRARDRVRSARHPHRRRRTAHGAPPGSAGQRRTTPSRAAPSGAPRTPTNPINVAIGNLFYGTEGWAAMSDQGFQAYKGESSELIMEERPERGPGSDTTGLHMENFLAACRSRNYKELHDEIGNAYLSASLCHLANISYRTGHKLTIEPGPKFAGDAAANKLLTRDVYRKPYVV